VRGRTQRGGQAPRYAEREPRDAQNQVRQNMNVKPIAIPLPGEHLAATFPTMRPETEAGYRQRLNFWAGRALTADALELEQENRAAHLTWQGRLVTPGIVSGLEVALEEPANPKALTLAQRLVHVPPGHGFSATGGHA